MRRLLLGVLTLTLLLPGAAQADSVDSAASLRKATGLAVTPNAASLQAAHDAMVGFMRREQHLQGSDGFDLWNCRRTFRRTVTCLVYEYGVPNDLHIFDGGGSFDLGPYRLRAERIAGHWRIWSPDIIFGP